MNIALLETFYSGSHEKWAKAYQNNSQHQLSIFSLKGKYWKWRMYGGALSLAEQYLQSDFQADLLLATDMLDLSTFLGITRQATHQIPTAIYFHENQITYPWSPTDQDIPLNRNNQYGFINFTSAIAADYIFFNSDYHRNSFLGALPQFLKQFPDHRSLHQIEQIAAKSSVLHLGMDLQALDIGQKSEQEKEAVLLWNHRWEYDKNPEAFFTALFRLKGEQIPFKLIVLGESYQRQPEIFAEAKDKLASNIIHYGYADSFEQYRQLLHLADILPVTSNQDFFGGSVVEAIYCNCYPILPNRLAYPEHIPDELKSKHLYQSEEAFFDLLKNSIKNVDTIRRSKYSDFVAQYDWSILAKMYDRSFEQLILK